VQSAAAGGVQGERLGWMNHRISNSTGYDDSWSGFGWRFASGALNNAALAGVVGVAGNFVGAKKYPGGPGSTQGIYDWNNWWRAFYNTKGDYAYYRDRVNEFMIAIGLSVWYEFEHTVPQRWTKDSKGKPLLARRVWSNAPWLLIPVLPWFNVPFLEGKSNIWWPVTWAVNQIAYYPVREHMIQVPNRILTTKGTLRKQFLGDSIRVFYALPVTILMVAGVGGAVYAGYAWVANQLNGPPNTITPALPA
jgi:hypothetical protein